MTATINTDASHNSDHNVGAFAYWISTSVGKVKQAGIFKEKIICSSEAEIKCIANGIFHLQKAFKKYKIETVYINTDSRSAISAIKSGQCTNEKIKATALLIRKIAKDNKWELVTLKVKAHTRGSTPRTYVNNWCDKECRKLNREQVKQMKENAPTHQQNT